MNTKLPAFSPFTVHGKHLSNRLVVAPMSRVSATLSGMPTPVMKSYYSAFAKGGFGMIITEGLYTDNYFSQAYPHQPGMATIQQGNSWQNITEAVRQYGTVFIAQLMHAGAISQSLSATIAPSAIQPIGRKMPEYGGGEGGFPCPAGMDNQDINHAVDGFVQSAINAHKAGFDGIEIHAANGYLLDQFLTRYANLRNDEYGGAIENRFRIIEQIIQRIREVMPLTFIIGLRLSEGKVNNLYYRWPDGSAMAKAMLEQVNKFRPDYIHIAAESGNWQRDCTYTDGSSFTGLAKQITGLPVIANGGLHDLEKGGEVLSSGQADLLAIGKAALVNPDWPSIIIHAEEPILFHPDFIKPSATVEHANNVRASIIDRLETAGNSGF